MATLLEQLEIKAKKALKSAKAAEARDLKARQDAIAERKAIAAIRVARARMIGDTIDDADIAGDLTPQEKATIGHILARRTDTPKDWGLLAEWMPAPAPLRPKFDKPDLEAAE